MCVCVCLCVCVCVCGRGGGRVVLNVLSSSPSSSVATPRGTGTPLLTANAPAGELQQRGNAAGGVEVFATAPSWQL